MRADTDRVIERGRRTDAATLGQHLAATALAALCVLGIAGGAFALSVLIRGCVATANASGEITAPPRATPAGEPTWTAEPEPTATPDALGRLIDAAEKRQAEVVRMRDAASTELLTLDVMLRNMKAARGR